MPDQQEAALTIGALADRSGCSVPTIRYYEDIGLLSKPRRQPNGHRVYAGADVQRLTFIRRCRDFGFAIEQVRDFMALYLDDQRDCTEARDLAQGHLNAVQQKLAELRALESSLTGMVQSCTARCAGGVASRCTIFSEIIEPVPTAMPGNSCCVPGQCSS